MSTDPNLQLTEAQLQTLFETATAQSARSMGAPDPNALYSTMLSQYDRFGVNTMMPNHEVTGYTFITRPKLNFSTTSLRQDRILSMLDTADPTSLPYAIRCYLDTNFSNGTVLGSVTDQVKQKNGQNCPFFNIESPFLIPLSNNLVSVAGWPDPVIDTETSDGGFFSEDMTMAKGSDRLNRTYDLTLTFRDIQGGFVLALLYMWYWYIALVIRGDVTAYPEDIAARRINYTCSIYRFIMDPSKQIITKWSKATGCFPKSIPIGNIFNFGQGEKFISSSAQYSIPFTANKIEIWDPIIFRDFNTISKRFSPTIQGYPGNGAISVDLTPGSKYNNQPFQFVTVPSNNFTGLPFVDLLGGYNRLLWIAQAGATTDPYTADWNATKALLAASLASDTTSTSYNT